MTRTLKKIDIFKLNLEIKTTRNIRCDSPKYLGVSKKHRWTCLICNYKWEAIFNSVMGKAQTGCFLCSVKRKSFDFDENKLNELLKNRNIFFLPNQIYINALTKYKWGCKICGNIWKTTYNNIIDKKSGCRKCFFKQNTGKNNSRWNENKKRKQYPTQWNEKLKKYVRDRDNHKCQYPDCYFTDIGKIRALDVHHIDDDENNSEPYNLISLCVKHHGAMSGRNYLKWMDYFYSITEKYNYDDDN